MKRKNACNRILPTVYSEFIHKIWNIRYKNHKKPSLYAYSFQNNPYFCLTKRIIIQKMKKKTDRLDAIKMIVSSKEISSQDELLQALKTEGFDLTQATLSRDLKQMKVAKAANTNGKYVYVLPNDIMYKRNNIVTASEMLMNSGFVSLQFSGNIAVIRTRPGYASSMAYDIDNRECPAILGTIAGDDTIMLVLHEAASHDEVRIFLSQVIPNLH